MEALPVTYLDTHVVLWLFARADKGLSAAACSAIETADALRISPMVILELDLLNEIGRTRIGAATICGYLKDRIGLSICDRPFAEVAARAGQMTWTRDPFDRIITAQAALAAAALVTKDRSIRANYPLAVW